MTNPIMALRNRRQQLLSQRPSPPTATSWSELPLPKTEDRQLADSLAARSGGDNSENLYIALSPAQQNALDNAVAANSAGDSADLWTTLPRPH